MNTTSRTSALAAAEALNSAPITGKAGLHAALTAMNPAHRAPLGTLLTAAGVVDDQQVREAMAEQKQHPEAKLGDLLVASGELSEEDLYQALGRQMGIPYVRLREFDIEPAALALLPHDLLRARRVLPLMLHGERLVLATDDPANSSTLSALRFRAQRSIDAVLATPSDLDAAIAIHCPPFESTELKLEAERTPKSDEALAAETLAMSRPVVRLVNDLLLNAIQRRASDIHLRPGQHHAEARYRIDGSLILISEFSRALMPAIVARIRILATLDITEHRLPQDGAIRIDTPHGSVDMRVSIMPAVCGENVVIRILDRSVGLRRLADIGFDAHDEPRMRALIDRNQGLVLVTGPTGSGKTTTLYAALQEINNGEYHIITVEDPVEYRLDGVVQIQVNRAIDYGFPIALRHILRHDPDVILIGEIRDAETAKIAIESSLTGHLVLSTLHTNSAAQSITRLIEIGVPSYLVSATLAGVLAQRLARRNCEHCKTAETVSAETRVLLDVGMHEKFSRGAGCDHCSGTGYRGRVAVYELMQMSPVLRELVHAGASYAQIETSAVQEGMVPLTTRALALARAGSISLNEVLRVRLD